MFTAVSFKTKANSPGSLLRCPWSQRETHQTQHVAREALCGLGPTEQELIKLIHAFIPEFIDTRMPYQPSDSRRYGLFPPPRVLPRSRGQWVGAELPEE